MPSKPPLLLLIGPSATGKTSVVAELARRGAVTVLPTWTTRPRRPDETGGCVNHEFGDDATFDRLDAEGFFAGTTRLFGLDHRYGLPRFDQPDMRSVPTVVARAAVVPAISRLHPSHRVWQVEAPADRVLLTMAQRRTPTGEADARLRDLDDEVAAGRVLAERVFVNDGRLVDVVDAMERSLRTMLLTTGVAA